MIDLGSDLWALRIVRTPVSKAMSSSGIAVIQMLIGVFAMLSRCGTGVGDLQRSIGDSSSMDRLICQWSRIGFQWIPWYFEDF